MSVASPQVTAPSENINIFFNFAFMISWFGNNATLVKARKQRACGENGEMLDNS